MSKRDGPRTMSTVETSWKIIHALKNLDGARVTELSNYLDMAKPTVYTHLTTLKEEGYVIKNGEYYDLGIKFLKLGEYVKNRDTLYMAGKSEVNDLANQTGEYVHLVTEKNHELIYLHGAQGENAVGEKFFEQKFEDPGQYHNMACGKALLAFLPEEKIDFIIKNSNLEPHTEHTITSEEELRENLETIRDRGFAVNDEEEILGTRAVGAPIFDNESILGAISITIPISRVKDDDFYDNIPELVMRTANAIEVQIQTLQNKEE